MKAVRIIPRLDIKGPNVVKGVHMEGLRVLGKPERFARHYYENGADELIYQDVVASLYGRNSLMEIIAKTSREIFIPLTVGGGLRSIEDIRAALTAGADKVCLNTAAIRSPELIGEAATVFGSSTIVIAIEAMKQMDGTYEAFTENGRERTGKDVFEWARQVESLGAGEIIITSIEREGTGNGFDLDLVARVAKSVSIPVIAHGGAGKALHVVDVLVKGQADSVCIASIFHYDCLKSRNSVGDQYEEGNTDYLRHGQNSNEFESLSISQLRRLLSDYRIICRLPRPNTNAMTRNSACTVAIVDMGLGNLFSIQKACQQVGLRAVITNKKVDIASADAVILPGVGAFGKAMQNLIRLGLVEELQRVSDEGKPMLAICLGMQLLMDSSQEFGIHDGLGIVGGIVRKFRFNDSLFEKPVKVPNIGWHRIYPIAGERMRWTETPLAGFDRNVYMYFVHSYYVELADNRNLVSLTRYSGFEYCSALRYKNVFGFQFHPERSGPEGIQIYREFAKMIPEYR